MIEKPRARRARNHMVNCWREPIHEWAVILAGGDGTRLRELSYEVSGDRRPKQFCEFFGGKTLTLGTGSGRFSSTRTHSLCLTRRTEYITGGSCLTSDWARNSYSPQIGALHPPSPWLSLKLCGEIPVARSRFFRQTITSANPRFSARLSIGHCGSREFVKTGSC